MGRVLAFVLALLTGTAAETALSAEDPGGDFVGQVRDLDGGAIAISTDGYSVLAYVCDGNSKRITIARWFKGKLTDNAISLVAGKATIDGQLDAAQATGTVTLDDGRSFKFRAVSPDPGADAGLFRSELDSAGHHYIAGWIEEPTRNELPATQLAFLEGWFDWSKAGTLGGIVDELHAQQPAPTIGPTTTRVPSPLGEFEIHRIRHGRIEQGSTPKNVSG